MLVRVVAFAAVFLAPFAHTAAAAQTAQGRLVDVENGAPVAGARIAVVGRPAATTSDGDGRFEIDAPAPPYVLLIILASGRVARPVEVTSTGPLDLRVDAAVSEFVTVSGVSPSLDVTPGAASTWIAGDDLVWRAPATLSDALEGVPGAHFVSQGQAAVPSIRGLARGRTLILVDGGRAGSERRAGSNASFVDPMSVAGIEVARGFGSVAYGSDAFGGVIAIRTRRPDPARRFAARFVGSVGAGWPSGRGEIELASGYGAGAVSVSARGRELDDYRSPEGDVPNSGWRERGVRVAWDHDAAAGRLSVTWQHDAGRDLGRPRSDDDVVRVTGLREDSNRLTASWDAAQVGPFRRVVVDALVGGTREVTEQDRAAMGMRSRSVERNDAAYKDAQVRVMTESPLAGASVEAGVDLQARFGLEVSDAVDAYTRNGVFTSTTETTSVESARSISLGLFAQARRPIGPRLSVAGGLRGEYVGSRNLGGHVGDRSSSLTAVAGFGSATTRLTPRWSATVQLARGFRSPTLSDRFSRGPVGRGFFEGNPGLDVETSLQLDAGTTFVTRRTRLAAFWYRYRVADLIERYAIDPDHFTFRNRPAAILTGVEVEAQADVGRGLLVEAALGWARGRDAADDSPIDDVPPATATLTARYLASTRLASFVRISGVGAHDGGPNEVATPGYVRVDAGGSVRVSRALQVDLAARNLFDARAYASAGPRWVYAPGRRLTLTLVASY